jgi:hypothetical protein
MTCTPNNIECVRMRHRRPCHLILLPHTASPTSLSLALTCSFLCLSADRSFLLCPTRLLLKQTRQTTGPGIMFRSTCPDAVEMTDNARTYSAAVQRLRRASRRLIRAGVSRQSCFLYKPPLRCGFPRYKDNCTPWGLYAPGRPSLSCTSFAHDLSPTNTSPGRCLRRFSLSMA